MPNPNRPQYQDTIEETWGQAVADTVVRRYANSADRDADLAGLTPAELAGQVVAIAPGGGAAAYLQQHDGTQWNSHQFSYGGVAAVTTDQYGNWRPTLPSASLGAVRTTGAVANLAQSGNLAIIMVRNVWDVAAESVTVIFSAVRSDGTNPANTTISATWVITYTKE
jgi:hypothetical protein